MKLYIPTSSLNIDNILSTESIAPYSYYKHREFGYQAFFNLYNNRFENGILLFTSIPNYTIVDPTRENHPMIIQIEDDAQFNGITPIYKEGECSIFYWTQPIHINPANTQILFFSKKAEVLSKQNCLDSKMCKLVDLFRFNYCEPSSYILPNLLASINNIDEVPQQSHIDETMHDKAKGFVYGYYIGASISVSPESARLARIQKRIYDIVASLANNQGQRNTLLEAELRNLDHEYESLDPMVSKAKTSWEQFVEKFELPVEKLNGFLKDLGLEYKAKTDFCKREGIVFRRTISQYRSLSEYNNDLQYHIKSILREDRKQSLNKTNLTKELDINPNFDLSLLSGSDDNSSLFNSILVRIIWGNLIPSFEELRINRFSIATEITKAVKDILESKGREWQDSKEQSYFHNMRQNIQDFTPFDLNEIDDTVIKSLVAIILKGEDFEALIDYLENNNFADYRYALAMWGALQGYVRIPRSVFSEYIKKDKLQQLLRDVNELLYKSSLVGELVIPTIPIQEAVVPSIMNNESQSITTIEDWRKHIKAAAEKAIKGQKQQDKLRTSLEDALNQNGDNMDAFIFVTLLDNFDGWRPTKTGPCSAWQRLQSLISPDYYERTKSQSKSKSQGKKSLWDKGREMFGIKDGNKDVQRPKETSFTQRKSAKSEKPIPKEGTIDFEQIVAKEEKKTNVPISEVKPISDYPDGLPRISCFEGLPQNVLRRLKQDWEYTLSKYSKPEERAEQIRFFLNLCKKEGRGDAPQRTSLTGIFTGTLAQQAEIEIYRFYNLPIIK